MASNITDAANTAGQKKGTDPTNPSIISSEGAIGKQFNPDGSLGGMAQKIGGPLDKDGMIGSQFDASKNGIAGHVEKAVDGPSNPTQH
ncbi:hypothetical protein M501DRAFT_1000738 [Patellaria atrata CBS 101060]|uniref:Uncharacterized protein n=1 Tax=Patellaria atrata CBS 101060 TaxID=1346257 RepID=A0A9P4SFD2_9PEZI|nr:hypothetical protein M501DRAFT_1000738 [Patellaria atrata CBS 101060]